ncbi:P-loop containing nucleoside triphosphate hydrolase protein [Mycena crocata]|nr:P-loop containing nucleoside triphosphate hydrolase protein [Mycena crocata]
MDSPTDDFVNIWEAASGAADNEFHRVWSEGPASGKHPNPVVQAAAALRKLYPDHSQVFTYLNVLGFPKVLSAPLPNAPLVSHTRVLLRARTNNKVSGYLADSMNFGAFQIAWDNYDFIVYVINYPQGFGTQTSYIILHQGPEEHGRAFLLAAGLYEESLHEEIWVFNQGFWNKDHQLWIDCQSADWKDVILKEAFKKELQKDVYGFFKSEAIYRELAIPWKRGLILHGPPGNGKTISIKVIMKTCDALGFAPLYVKSFQSWKGEEGAMLDVFEKARQLSPCVIVLEDLDALITDRNRSFFLNQLDGLQGNDGLLVIGTTNHFDRLDPGLSTRPSRFDRKYLFDDPDREERALYAKYWQRKLKSNDKIEYPDSLVDEVADQTEQFSFAYLKEAFVSCLVTLAGWEGDDKPTFSTALKAQIKTLRKQLDKIPREEVKRDFRPLFDTLSEPPSFVFPPAASNLFAPTNNFAPHGPPSSAREPDFRVLLDRLQQGGLTNNVERMEMLSKRLEAMQRLLQPSGTGQTSPTFVAPSAWDSPHTHILGMANESVQSPKLD